MNAQGIGKVRAGLQNMIWATFIKLTCHLYDTNIKKSNVFCTKNITQLINNAYVIIFT